MSFLHKMTFFSKNLDPGLELVLAKEYKLCNPTLSPRCSVSLIEGRNFGVFFFNLDQLNAFAAAQPLIY